MTTRPTGLLLALTAVLAALSAAGCSMPRRAPNPSFSISRTDADADLARMAAAPIALERPLVVLAGIGDPAISSSAILRGVAPCVEGRIVELEFFNEFTFDGARQKLLREVIPARRTRAYDVRRVIDLLMDSGSVLELRPRFGAAAVTALARLEGRPVGVIASNPMVNAGALGSDESDKLARFIQLCDGFDLPIVSLCDTPGFMVGPQAETTAQIRHCSRIFVTAANVTVPILTVILRKAYGLGGQAMAGGSFHKSSMMTVAWPTAEFGSMGLEGQIRLGYRAELEAIADPVDEHELLSSVGRSHRHHEPSAVGELFQERFGHLLPRCRDEDDVEGCRLRPSERPVPPPDVDVAVEGGPERLGGVDDQVAVAFDGPDLGGELVEHGGGVTGAGPHLEHPVRRPDGGRLEGERHDVGLGDGLARTDRQRAVLERRAGELLGHEPLTRDRPHGVEHPLITDAAPDQPLPDHPAPRRSGGRSPGLGRPGGVVSFVGPGHLSVAGVPPSSHTVGSIDRKRWTGWTSAATAGDEARPPDERPPSAHGRTSRARRRSHRWSEFTANPAGIAARATAAAGHAGNAWPSTDATGGTSRNPASRTTCNSCRPTSTAAARRKRLDQRLIRAT